MKNNFGYPDNRGMAGMQKPRENMRPAAPRVPTGRPGLPSGRSVMPSGTGATQEQFMPPDTLRPLVPLNSAAPLAGEAPSTVQSPYYTAGFLRNFLGRSMRVEFLIGTSGALVDRIGELVEVGASYIVLRPLLSDDLIMCDLYSIKFVTIFD
ncbi:MAG: hypothetical protein WDA65_06775 [Christensenellales bacterium]